MSQITSDGVQQCSQADGIHIGIHMKKSLPGAPQPVSAIIILLHSNKLKIKYRLYSSTIRAQWDCFDLVLLCIGHVYHSSGQSFNAIPVFGSISNHWAIACSQVPLLQGRLGMLTSIIGRFVAVLKPDVVLSISGVTRWSIFVPSTVGSVTSVGAACWELGTWTWDYGLGSSITVSILRAIHELIGGVTVGWGMNEFALWSIEKIAEVNIRNSFVVTGCTRIWLPIKLLSASVDMGQRVSL